MTAGDMAVEVMSGMAGKAVLTGTTATAVETEEEVDLTGTVMTRVGPGGRISLLQREVLLDNSKGVMNDRFVDQNDMSYIEH